LNIRELRPKDYYFFSLINNDYPDITQTHLILLIICRLAGMQEENLSMIPARFIKPLSEWLGPNILTEKVMTVEQWLEMAFHLCKQRWDSSVEWLEQQPVSKILLMAKLQFNFATKQNEEMKRAARKKK
jgi:hypothetical protein